MASQSSIITTTPSLPHPLFRLPAMDPKQRFHNHFLDSVAILRDQIAQLESCAAIPGERQEAIDHSLAAITKLQNEVADAAEFTPSYDRRQYAETVKTLQDTLNATIAKVTPRSRFQFKRPSKPAGHVDMGAPMNDPRLNPGSRSPNSSRSPQSIPSTSLPSAPASRSERSGSLSNSKDYNAKLAAQAGALTRRPSFSAASSITLTGHGNLHIVLPPSASAATSSGSLTNLRRCVIDLSAASTPASSKPESNGSPFRGLAMRDITDCVIVAGRVDGPVHITGVVNSILVVAARQVRIHECKNVDIYLHCGSHPIIEDCSGMRFAPLPSAYAIESDSTIENQWEQVDDFKWLKAGPSPNWTTMSEAERLSEDVWTQGIRGDADESVDEMLRKLRIRRRSRGSSLGSISS